MSNVPTLSAHSSGLRMRWSIQQALPQLKTTLSKCFELKRVLSAYWRSFRTIGGASMLAASRISRPAAKGESKS